MPSQKLRPVQKSAPGLKGLCKLGRGRFEKQFCEIIRFDFGPVVNEGTPCRLKIFVFLALVAIF